MTDYASFDPFNNNLFTLSGGNLSITGTDAYAYGVKMTDPKTAGKFYAEFKFTNIGVLIGANLLATRGVGICALGAPFTALPMSFTGPTNAAFLGIGGSVSAVYNRQTLYDVGGGLVWTSGDIICIAVNLDDGLIWWRINSGDWNNNPSAAPGSNTGGFDISSITPGVVLYVMNDPNNTNFHLDATVDPTGFIYSAPLGYGGWTKNEPNNNLFVPKLTSYGSLLAPNLAIRKLTSYASLLAPNLAVRKLTAYALIQRIPDFGPIPVFPVLPVGFPTKISPVMDTTLGTTKSLREVRVANQTEPLWDIEIIFEGLRDETQNQVKYAPFLGFTQYMDLVQLWLSMYGQTNVFLFDAPWDNSRLNQTIATGDGQTYIFPIIRTWGQGSTATVAQIGAINTLTSVKLNGVEADPATYFIDRNVIVFNDNSGVVHPPPAGVVITMTFSFYYLCRFVEDEQDFEEFAKDRWTLSSLKFRAEIWPNERYPG